MIRRKKRKSPRIKNTSRQSQYEDIRWKEKREKIFKRDNYKCQSPKCEGLTNELHCHHIRYTRGDLWDTPDELLISLCVTCHSLAHGRHLGRKVVIKRKK